MFVQRLELNMIHTCRKLYLCLPSFTHCRPPAVHGLLRKQRTKVEIWFRGRGSGCLHPRKSSRSYPPNGLFPGVADLRVENRFEMQIKVLESGWITQQHLSRILPDLVRAQVEAFWLSKSARAPDLHMQDVQWKQFSKPLASDEKILAIDDFRMTVQTDGRPVHLLMPHPFLGRFREDSRTSS